MSNLVDEASSLKSFLETRSFIGSFPPYEEARAGFHWPRLGRWNWGVQYFDGFMVDRASWPALVWVDDELLETGDSLVKSYHELREESNRLANGLESMGLGKGDSVLVMTGNIPELFTVFLALIKTGMPGVPATVLLTPDDVLDRVRRARVRAVIGDRVSYEKIEAVRDKLEAAGVSLFIAVDEGHPRGWTHIGDVMGQGGASYTRVVTNADDLALIYFTSGTTARPKMVFHTHASYPAGHLTTMYWVGAREGWKHYNISSPGWAKWAWSTFFTAFNSGATSMVYAYKRFNAPRVLRFISEYGVNSLCAPPTVWRMFILEDLSKYNFDELRSAVSAGEPLNPKVIEKVRGDVGVTIREGYGQTETTLQIGFFPGMQVKPGSMGKPAPGYDIVLVDPEGNPVPPGEDGQIAIRIEPERPLGLMKGYDNPAKNQQVFRLGLYWTGDVATMDKEGYFYFVGRADDVFKSSDYRISPFEVESELIKHPAVAEVAVVPSPHPIKWTVPKAYILLKPGYKPSPELARDIFEFARKNMAPYKRPRIIQFVDELPKTISGKIRRVQLRRREMERRPGERMENEYFEEDFFKKPGNPA